MYEFAKFLAVLCLAASAGKAAWGYHVALKDGRVIEFRDYRVTKKMVFYIDDQDKECSVPLSSFDLERAQQLNVSENPPLHLSGLSLSNQPQTNSVSQSLADVARRVRAEKEQKARQQKTVEVYQGVLNFTAKPKFSNVPDQLISAMEVQIQNTGTMGYRYALTVKCGEWREELSGNIEGSSSLAILKEKTISLDLPTPCSWNDASLEQVREAEGLEGPEPKLSKVPGIDDTELVRRSKKERVERPLPANPASPVRSFPSSSVGGAQLALLSASERLDSGFAGNFAVVEGEVQNLTNKPLSNIAAVASWYTKDGAFITSDVTLIEYNPILPGQTSPFHVISTANPETARYSLAFEVMNGGTVSIEDRR